MGVWWEDTLNPWTVPTRDEVLDGGPTPPCTDLISETEDVLRSRERWPAHLCYEEFLCESTRLWAEQQPFVGRDLNIIQQWSTMHPLPIGHRALMISRNVKDLSEWAEVSSVVPFNEYQSAMWAVRVKGEWSPTNEQVLDLFGLAEYPTENHQRFGIPVAGDLAYVLRGTDMYFPDILQAARRWWAQFKGRPLRGRPPNSGIFQSADEYRAALITAATSLRAEGYKATQETIADYFGCDSRQIRRWNDQWDIDWNDVISK